MTKRYKILTVVAIVVVICGAVTAWQIYKSQFWRGPDAQFGDQHLKTSVALIELHKVRYGKYPSDLNDIKFTGAWDPMALNSVRYKTNATQTRYCLEVQTGWIGKPTLTMPPEFWQGTGYDPSLCHW